MTTIWLRDEVKENEKRTALTPENAKKLLEAGHSVIVEESKDRAIDISEYEKVGAKIVKSHSWKMDAPKDCYVLGLKELEESKESLSHNHIYFAHIYKGQSGAKEVFTRFKNGGGTLFDLEFLQLESGKRVAAFGYWAGYVGAALAVENYCSLEQNGAQSPLKHYKNKNEWIQILKLKLENIKKPKSIIIGALGRCGTGANQLLQDLNLKSTKWDFEETKKGGPFKEILEHDIFVNTVLMSTKIQPFLDTEMITSNKFLKVIADVSCDPNSSLNPLPIYTNHTTWKEPLSKGIKEDSGINVIAIDNLPSALPLESSYDFSDQLFPHILNLCNIGLEDYTWKNAKNIFEDKKRAH